MSAASSIIKPSKFS
jgi:hypothetical protein